jgi:hypothetical protein
VRRINVNITSYCILIQENKETEISSYIVVIDNTLHTKHYMFEYEMKVITHLTPTIIKQLINHLLQLLFLRSLSQSFLHFSNFLQRLMVKLDCVWRDRILNVWITGLVHTFCIKTNR